MDLVRTLMSGIVFGESPRWGPDGRLWLADWGAGRIVAVDLEGASEVMTQLDPSFQVMCIDWLRDGRLLIVSSREGLLLRREPDGSLVTHADLNEIGGFWNEIVVDGRGNVYVNEVGFNMAAGEDPAPGSIVLLTPDGSLRRVGEGLMFPNGIAVTPDNSTLICAESYGRCLTAFDIAPDGSLSNRRVWADLGDGVPDGICIDSDGAVWYADVPNKRCLRVRGGGERLQAVELDVGAFSCALGGEDRRTLFMVVREWTGPATMLNKTPKGEVLAIEAPAPGAGWP